MNKILLLSVIALLTALKSFAQTEVTLKYSYSPERSYTTVTKSSFLNTMRFVGDAKVQAQLKAKGIKQPMVLSMYTDGKVSSKTGKLDSAAQRIPIVMRYDKLQTQQSFNGQQMNAANPLEGKTMYGNVMQGKLHIDSIGGLQVPDTTIRIITNTMNSIFNQIQFPDKALRVGEAFTQAIPLSLPIPGASQPIVANISTTYKLMQINNGKALLDITQKIVYHMNIAGKTMTASGGGAGKLVYNIPDKILEDYHTTFDINMRMQMDKTTTMVANMHANSATTITINH